MSSRSVIPRMCPSVQMSRCHCKASFISMPLSTSASPTTVSAPTAFSQALTMCLAQPMTSALILLASNCSSGEHPTSASPFQTTESILSLFYVSLHRLSVAYTQVALRGCCGCCLQLCRVWPHTPARRSLSLAPFPCSQLIGLTLPHLTPVAFTQHFLYVGGSQPELILFFKRLFHKDWRRLGVSQMRLMVLLASNERRSGLLLNILQSTRQAPWKRILQPKISITQYH